MKINPSNGSIVINISVSPYRNQITAQEVDKSKVCVDCAEQEPSVIIKDKTKPIIKQLDSVTSAKVKTDNSNISSLVNRYQPLQFVFDPKLKELVLEKKEDYSLSSKAHQLQKSLLTGSVEEVEEAIKEINALARRAGLESASIQAHYEDKSKGKFKHVTVPAINGRVFTNLMVYSALQAGKQIGVPKDQPIIFELAKSESSYTGQKPAIFAALVKLGYLMAGARNQKMYIQGDHFQVNKANFWSELTKAGFAGAKAKLTKEEIEQLSAETKTMTLEAKKALFEKVTKFLNESKAVKEIVDLCRDAIKAGYRNIDIDSSVLERENGTPFLKQQWNGLVCAYLISQIRQMEKEFGIKKSLSLGGEVGEVGKDSTTKADFEAYFAIMKEYLAFLGKDILGPSKFAVTTGTAHGGVRDASGKILRKVPIRFDILSDFSAIKNPWIKDSVRQVTVQHGASTLDPELYKGFAAIGVGEVHLATEYQIITMNVIKEMAPDIYKKLQDILLKDESISAIKSQKTKYANYKTDTEVQKKFFADKDTFKAIAGPKESIKLLMNLKPEVYHEISKRLSTLFAKQFENLRLNKGSLSLTAEEEKIAQDVISANKAAVKVKTVASED